jgi:hypothetical protein
MTSTCRPDSSWARAIVLRYAADDFRGSGRNRVTGLGACGTDAGRYVAGSQERRVVRVDHRLERGKLGRPGQQVGQFRRNAGRGPGAHRFLEQPQAGHVVQITDPAVDPGLVGEARPVAGLGQHGLVQLHPDQRPRSAGYVGEIAALGRHRGHRGCGVV